MLNLISASEFLDESLEELQKKCYNAGMVTMETKVLAELANYAERTDAPEPVKAFISAVSDRIREIAKITCLKFNY